MDVRLTWTDCDEAGDYVAPNVLSPRDLVSRPDNMDETVPHTTGLALKMHFISNTGRYRRFIIIHKILLIYLTLNFICSIQSAESICFYRSLVATHV